MFPWIFTPQTKEELNLATVAEILRDLQHYLDSGVFPGK